MRSKGKWWTPWQLGAMKDVASCDKPREAAKQALIRGFLNGSALHGEAMEERTEISRCVQRTR